jgi:hypothetical protein
MDACITISGDQLYCIIETLQGSEDARAQRIAEELEISIYRALVSTSPGQPTMLSIPEAL